MEAVKIKPSTHPFTTHPNHEHVFKRTGSFRKYDIKTCKVLMETSNPKKAAAHRANKDFKGPFVCGKRIFVLRRRVRNKKMSAIQFMQPDIVVPVHLTNAFSSVEMVSAR